MEDGHDDVKRIRVGETKVLERFRLEKVIIVHDCIAVVEAPCSGRSRLVVSKVDLPGVDWPRRTGQGYD